MNKEAGFFESEDRDIDAIVAQIEKDPNVVKTQVHASITVENGEVTKQDFITEQDGPEKRAIFLSKQRELIVEQLKANAEQLEAALTAVGVGKFFQDSSDGTVFQVVKPKGKYVYFSDVDYIRTKRAGEEKGDLSVVKAQEAGFTVPGAKAPKKRG